MNNLQKPRLGRGVLHRLEFVQNLATQQSHHGNQAGYDEWRQDAPFHGFQTALIADDFFYQSHMTVLSVNWTFQCQPDAGPFPHPAAQTNTPPEQPLAGGILQAVKLVQDLATQSLDHGNQAGHNQCRQDTPFHCLQTAIIANEMDNALHNHFLSSGVMAQRCLTTGTRTAWNWEFFAGQPELPIEPTRALCSQGNTPWGFFLVKARVVAMTP
jgi:hypothetical protein